MSVDTYALTTLAKLKAWLGITVSTYDTLLEASIDRASAKIESYCGREFLSRAQTEWKDTWGAERFVLKHSPVTNVRFIGTGTNSVLTVASTTASDVAASVTVHDDSIILYRMSVAGTAFSTTLLYATYPTTTLLATQISATAGFSGSALLDIPSTRMQHISGRDLTYSSVLIDAPTQSLFDYQLDTETGIVYGSTLRQYRSIFVDYTAGYATTPHDVEQCATNIAARIFNSRLKDSGVTSESLGGYSYSTKTSTEIDSEEKEMLRQYRRVR